MNIGVMVALGIVVLLVLYVVAAYNGFVRLKNMVEEAFSTMDVYLKKRFDLIPNLVETVKGYAAHEKGTLDAVTKARSMIAQGGSAEERMENENILSGALRSLFAVSENYPDLKANQNFMDLQGQLSALEEDIANSRKYYNGVVRQFNTKTEAFPSNIIASIFKMNKKPMFEVDDAQERKNVKVSF